MRSRNSFFIRRALPLILITIININNYELFVSSFIHSSTAGTGVGSSRSIRTSTNPLFHLQPLQLSDKINYRERTFGSGRRSNCGRRVDRIRVDGIGLRSTVHGDGGPTIDFDTTVQSRYACTRFQRQGGRSSTDTDSKSSNNTKLSASVSNSTVVDLAFQCLNLSRRAPSGFNAQPYRLLMVHTKSKKEQLAKFCLGRNADRVRDSDCTVVFLADKECLREYKRFSNFLDGDNDDVGSSDSNRVTGKKKKTLSKWGKRKMQLFILLFSSGWPLPRILSNPISFATRLGVSTVSVITRRKVLVPSLSSAETWASKNTMLVAMTYMLACSSRGLATCPMEGFNAGGIRKVLSIPRRYAIPLIVSTGVPYNREVEEEGYDDVGMMHGPQSRSEGGSGRSTRRYPLEEVVFFDEFGAGDDAKEI